MGSVIVMAFLPAVILLFYTYQQDKLQREPVREVMKGFFFGALSVLVSLMISVPFMGMGFFPMELNSFSDAVRQAFLGAAIPEETAKLLMLWLLLRNSKYYDERMDGIVYAVSVGMGFAAFENVEYLLASGSDWVTVGLGRALLAIPGHFGFAVVMGYYFSIYRFDRYRDPKAGLKMWLYPVLGHGLYDTVAMTASLNETVSGSLSIALVLFCFYLIKVSRRRMKEHLMADNADPLDNRDFWEPEA